MDDDDGLPLVEVGEWAKEKHERLRKYVDASRAARRKFVEGSGGATYIDLFCGSGRAIIRETNERIDGSPLAAFRSARDGGSAFSEVHLADVSAEFSHAAAARVHSAGGRSSAYVGRAEDTAIQIVKRLNPNGLHFAFLDPYSLQDLPFATIEALARLRRVDLLIHVSAQDLQRNLHSYIAPNDHRLDHFAPGWRTVVDTNQSQRAIRAAILAHWSSKVEALGLPPAEHAELVTGPTKKQRLYWLVWSSPGSVDSCGLADSSRSWALLSQVGLCPSNRGNSSVRKP